MTPEQLEEHMLMRFQDGRLTRISALPGIGIRLDPLKLESEQVRFDSAKIAEKTIEERDITWRTIYRKFAMRARVSFP